MLLKLFERNEKILYVGIIKKIKEGVGKGAGKLASVTISGKKMENGVAVDDEVEVVFCNGNVTIYDWFKNSNLGVGDFVSVLVNNKNFVEYYRTNGVWCFPSTPENKEVNFLIGKIQSVDEYDGRTVCRMPINNVFASITFFQNEKREAEKAARFLKTKDYPYQENDTWHFGEVDSEISVEYGKPYAKQGYWVINDIETGIKAEEKIKAIIKCGEAKDYNGKPQYVGYRFDVI